MQSAKTLNMSARSPTTSCTPNSRRGMQRFPSTNQFPDSPQPTSSSAATPPPTGGANWRNTSTPFSPRSTGPSPAASGGGGLGNRNVGAKEEPAVPMQPASDQQAEWVAGVPTSHPVVASKVPYTKSTPQRMISSCGDGGGGFVSRVWSMLDAQHEACNFLHCAQLEPDDSAIVLGLMDVLVRGIDEGITETPKFYERYVTVLHMITEKETSDCCDTRRFCVVRADPVAGGHDDP